MKEIGVKTNLIGQERLYSFISAIKGNLPEITDIKIDGDFLTIGDVEITVYTNFNSKEIFTDSESDLKEIKQIFENLLKREKTESNIIPFVEKLEGKIGFIICLDIDKEEKILILSFQKHDRIKTVVNSTDVEELKECLTDQDWHNLYDNPNTRQVGLINYEKSEARMFGLTFLKGIEDEGIRKLFKEVHTKLEEKEGCDSCQGLCQKSCKENFNE